MTTASSQGSPLQAGALPNTPRTRPDDPSPIIAREGWIILAIVVVLSAALAAGAAMLHPLLGAAVGALGVVLLLFCCWFFRDPQRAIPDEPGLVVSPADGVVIAIEPAQPPAELNLPAALTRDMQRVVIFLNVFNVHVNRTPIAGEVIAAAGKSGSFAHAGKPQAEHNERYSIALRLADGGYAAVTQVTGLIARRIVCRARAGDRLRTGQRYGLIRFGSRTDVYLPGGASVLVQPGQKTVGGVTLIARGVGLARDEGVQGAPRTRAD